MDLNSFLCKGAKIMEELFTKVEQEEKAKEYKVLREQLRDAIR